MQKSCLPITPKAYPTTTGNHEEQHIELMRKQKKVKNREWKLEDMYSRFNTSHLSKEKNDWKALRVRC
jgi:hypothetical protein